MNKINRTFIVKSKFIDLFNAELQKNKIAKGKYTKQQLAEDIGRFIGVSGGYLVDTLLRQDSIPNLPIAIKIAEYFRLEPKEIWVVDTAEVKLCIIPDCNNVRHSNNVLCFTHYNQERNKDKE